VKSDKIKKSKVSACELLHHTLVPIIDRQNTVRRVSYYMVKTAECIGIKRTGREKKLFTS